MARLEVRDVAMQFPAVRALDGVSLAFEPGEVHGVIGENGAGKSTLMRILVGLQQPTSGDIYLEGKLVRLSGVRHAMSLGIAMIHQELDLVDDLTVAENVFLGSEPRRFGIVDRKRMEAETAKLLSEVGARFNPRDRVGGLSIAGKQLVEVAKALSHKASVLIMDEPTSVLSDQETTALFRLIGELKEQGVTVIYISHRLAEVERVCDRISILRDGKLVSTHRRGEATQADMASLMVGRPLGDVFPPKGAAPDAPKALEVEDLTVPGFVVEASLAVRPGEILGLAGLVGSGRTELCEAIVGVRERSKGRILRNGKEVLIRSPREALRHGIAYASEDRKGAGLVLQMSAIENTTLPNLRAYARPVIRRKRERAAFEGWKRRLDIRVGDPDAEALYLSGGNQQKVCIAKWLETAPKVLILDEPTRGVDVGAKREIYGLIHHLASEGLACVVVSSEMPEIVGLCHRVLVMRSGKVAGELQGERITEDAIMALAAGVAA